MNQKGGRFTLPGETGMEDIVAKLAKEWQVDAVRDSDGTQLSQEILDMGLQVYSTLCLVRADNAYMKAHPEYRQQIYLLSEPYVAQGDTVEIDLMKKFFSEQFAPNTDCDIHRYWQVIDRTTGEVMPDFSCEGNLVTVKGTTPYHVYTVSFLAYQLWEPVSMYNHLTNDWGDREHLIPLDVRYPEAGAHTLAVLEEWLQNHPQTDVVRFTTFFYNFDLMYDEHGKERQVNWFGYAACVSPLALEEFEKEYGYPLLPEDLVDAGKYNTPFENPSKKYLDWMDFNQRFVSQFAKKCVDIVHKHGRKAIMFLGDHWAGTEPYGKYFQDIGLDAVVGAAGDGVTTRMIADIPVKETEARFYPYFFPDVFHEGGDPVGESVRVWLKCRRAMMRKPMDRMGYGGYLSLAYKFPDFISHVTDVAAQFRSIPENANGTKPYSAPFKVGVLNAWGHLRTWQTHQVAHSLWNQRCYSYLGAMEALAGLPFEVEFLSFEDIRNGVPQDIGVLINAGDAGTSWSGDTYWKDPQVVASVRKWVYEGGGFIGIGEPTACEYEGRFFQLADVLGVQKEVGLTASCDKPPLEKVAEHFITKDLKGPVDYGEGMTMIYKAADDLEVLDVQNGSCAMAAHACGKGRAVYFAGMPYDLQNARLLQRALYWAAHDEAEIDNWASDNVETEVTAYPETGRFSVVNNSLSPQEGTVHAPDGKVYAFSLPAAGCVWMDI